MVRTSVNLSDGPPTRCTRKVGRATTLDGPFGVLFRHPSLSSWTTGLDGASVSIVFFPINSKRKSDHRTGQLFDSYAPSLFDHELHKLHENIHNDSVSVFMEP